MCPTILCKIALLCRFLVIHSIFTKPCVTVSVARLSRRGRECKSTLYFLFFFFIFLKKGNTNCLRHNFSNIFYQLFCFFVIIFIVSAMSYTGAYSNFSLLVLRHRAVGPWSTTTTQFLSSNRTWRNALALARQLALV